MRKFVYKSGRTPSAQGRGTCPWLPNSRRQSERQGRRSRLRSPSRCFCLLMGTQASLPTMHWNTMKIRSIPIWSGHTEAQYWQHRRKRHERMYRRCRHIGWQAKRGATNGRNPEIALALLPKMRRQNKNADTGTYSLGGFSFILPEVQIYLRNSF